MAAERKRKGKANKSVVAFIDTNALLHYPPIKDIDWCKVCDADSVTIVLCLPVISELDKYKSDGRLGGRASARIKEIQTFRNKEVRPGVSIAVYNVPLAPEHTGKESDEKIALCAHMYRDSHGGNVSVISEDYGMQLRGEAHGILTLPPPPSQRLDNPQTDEQKKIKELERSIAELKHRRPAFELIVTPDNGHVDKLERPALRPLGEFMAEIEPTFDATLRGIGQWLDRDRRQNYMDHLRDWYLSDQRIADESARTISREMRIKNVGNAPAAQITLTMEFPDTLSAVMSGNYIAGTRTKPVREPHRYPNVKIPPTSTMSPPVILWDHSPFGYRLAGRQLVMDIRQLAHGDEWPIPEFHFTFRSWDDVKPFEVDVRIRTLEPPDLIEFSLPIRAMIG